MVHSEPMSTPTKPEAADQDEQSYDLTPEEEEELRAAYEDSLREEERGELIPHEALFPRRRATG